LSSFTAFEIFSIVIFWLIVWNRWNRQKGSHLIPLAETTGSLPPHPPLVSIIIPARNEADNIEECVKSILAQDYPNFEIIVVDDRSEDGTGEIVKRVSATDSRLQAIAGKELPPDWMGKAHAIHQGYQVAQGDWLLFTDADTNHAPTLLSKVMSTILPSQASLATAVGEQKEGSFGTWIADLAVFAYIFMVSDRKGFPDPRNRQSLVNGQYLLITREAYEALGTHKVLKDYSSTDVSLGYHAKLQGYLPMVINVGEELQTRMYGNFIAAFKGWSRSLVNGIWTALGPVTGSAFLSITTIGCLFFWVVPWLTWLDGLDRQDWAQAWVGFYQIMAVLSVLWIKSGRLIVAVRDLLVMPVSYFIFLAMVTNGLVSGLLRKGTIWKGRLVRTGKRLPPWDPKPPILR
jgi:chlorobactene glucosyltransferase